MGYLTVANTEPNCAKPGRSSNTAPTYAPSYYIALVDGLCILVGNLAAETVLK